MRILVMALTVLSVSSAFAGTGMVIAKQPNAPVQIVRTLHGIPDVLQSAWFENRGSKSIIGYRIGWASMSVGKSRFEMGPWMNVPAGVNPGATVEVPAQGVALDARAENMVFFVSEVKFADGSHWKANHGELLKRMNVK